MPLWHCTGIAASGSRDNGGCSSSGASRPSASPILSTAPRSTQAARSAQLRKMLDEDDVLMVTRLDRLARSTRDLLNSLAAIAGKKAGFRSLGDTWADTTTAHGRLQAGQSKAVDMFLNFPVMEKVPRDGIERMNNARRTLARSLARVESGYSNQAAPALITNPDCQATG